MNKPIILVALVALCVFCPRSRAELVVEVTQGRDDAIPIAIVPFNSAAEAAASFDVAQVINDDLARSGRFKAMARKDMIEQPHVGANIVVRRLAPAQQRLHRRGAAAASRAGSLQYRIRTL